MLSETRAAALRAESFARWAYRAGVSIRVWPGRRAIVGNPFEPPRNRYGHVVDCR